jgi:hypothetical protein
VRPSATGLVLLLTLSLAGCASSGTGAASDPVIAKSAIPTAAKLSPTALVTRVGLVSGDFSDGRSVRLINAGDEVAGQVTLDNCGTFFTTEAHRVARRQTAIVPEGRASFFSNEVVVYDTVAQAAKALNQLRSSVRHCPTDTLVPLEAHGVPAVRYDVSRLSTISGLPVKDSAQVVITISAKGTSKRLHGLFIFQRQGTVLDIVYLQTLQNPTSAETAVAQELAQITGKRLAAT